jgi:hypothetical protein
MKKYKVIDIQTDYDGASHIHYTLEDESGNIKKWSSSSPTWWEPESVLEIHNIGDIIYKDF